MTRYTLLTNIQLFVLAIMIGTISGAVTYGVQKYEQIKMLPIVTVDASGRCVKVTNFENGHAFGCQDVDILLRKYRTTK